MTDFEGMTHEAIYKAVKSGSPGELSTAAATVSSLQGKINGHLHALSSLLDGVQDAWPDANGVRFRTAVSGTIDYLRRLGETHVVTASSSITQVMHASHEKLATTQTGMPEPPTVPLAEQKKNFDSQLKAQNDAMSMGLVVKGRNIAAAEAADARAVTMAKALAETYATEKAKLTTPPPPPTARTGGGSTQPANATSPPSSGGGSTPAYAGGSAGGRAASGADLSGQPGGRNHGPGSSEYLPIGGVIGGGGSTGGDAAGGGWSDAGSAGGATGWSDGGNGGSPAGDLAGIGNSAAGVAGGIEGGSPGGALPDGAARFDNPAVGAAVLGGAAAAAAALAAQRGGVLAAGNPAALNQAERNLLSAQQRAMLSASERAALSSEQRALIAAEQRALTSGGRSTVPGQIGGPAGAPPARGAAGRRAPYSPHGVIGGGGEERVTWLVEDRDLWGPDAGVRPVVED